MATLHVFNPEHDIALATNLSNFTAPHAGRQLRADIGFLPAIWAQPEDYVLVDHAEEARILFGRLMHKPFDRFVEKRDLAKIDISQIEPWGWDMALCDFLRRYRVSETLLPTEEAIAEIRQLSHRQTAVGLLSRIRLDGIVGESVLADSLGAVRDRLVAWKHIVVKAPWSSSGRGLRFIDGTMNGYQQRWIENVIERQGSVVVEPYYNKVKDFALEFESDGAGGVKALGLSLFHTSNGAYTGNILATEDEKIEMISHYISADLMVLIQEKISSELSRVYKGKYKGPLGVDMMIVGRDDKNGFLLHPCVEINLRRTMGHVALAMAQQCRSGQVMGIDYSENHYKLKIKKI